jgi:hypothetical protein
MRKRRRYQLRLLRITFPTAPSFKNNSYSALGPAGGGRKTNLIVHSGIQTAPQQAKEYQLCEGNVIRVMQRIAFNMAGKRHNVPNWETEGCCAAPAGYFRRLQGLLPSSFGQLFEKSFNGLAQSYRDGHLVCLVILSRCKS